MRRIVALAVLLIALTSLSIFAQGPTAPFPFVPQASGGGANTWTLVQAPALFHCTASPCTYTVSVGAGHVVVICASEFDANSYITGITGGGTWTFPASLQVQWTGTASASCAYTLNSSSASSLSISLTISDSFEIGLIEASFSGASATFDNGAAAFDSSSSASQLGVTASLTGTSDFIIQWCGAGFNPTAISAGYTLGHNDGSGNADAYRINQSTMPQPTWTLAAATQAMVVGAAFK